MENKPRYCGVCQVADIPHGADWPYWREGKPVHLKCALALDTQKAMDAGRKMDFEAAKANLCLAAIQYTHATDSPERLRQFEQTLFSAARDFVRKEP